MKNFLCIFFILITTHIYSQGNYEKIKISDDLELIKLSEYSYIHVSYTQIEPFGRVPSNGFIYVNEGKAFLFDTPVTDSLTKELVSWIQDTMKIKIIGFIPNHWHSDCMGGLGYIQRIGIESYANELTCEIAKSKNLPVPVHGFNDSLILHLGDKEIICFYLGPAHTRDNIVTWFPSEKILFGGCMVKDLKSTNLGNTADADVSAWPVTLKKVLNKYSDAAIVIPGHGQFGDISLINHTIDLLNNYIPNRQ